MSHRGARPITPGSVSISVWVRHAPRRRRSSDRGQPGHALGDGHATLRIAAPKISYKLDPNDRRMMDFGSTEPRIWRAAVDAFDVKVNAFTDAGLGYAHPPGTCSAPVAWVTIQPLGCEPVGAILGRAEPLHHGWQRPPHRGRGEPNEHHWGGDATRGLAPERSLRRCARRVKRTTAMETKSWQPTANTIPPARPSGR